ncbi:MAG: hypothetical protein IH587_08810, partial [Anaerolineae bacterium]|nr:hypothetical protein [Anaerolineae bacterium]
STFGLAFFWFIGAIPAGAALNLALPVAALTAGISYAAGALIIVLIGAPLRARIIQRFNLSLEHDPQKLFWRAWDRFGLVGLGLLAPITVGSQIGTLIGLALGVAPARLLTAMAVGGALWSLAIALLVAVGVSVVQ